MAIVEIIKPNNTPEQEKKALKNIADAIKKSIEAEFRVSVTVEILKS